MTNYDRIHHKDNDPLSIAENKAMRSTPDPRLEDPRFTVAELKVFADEAGADISINFRMTTITFKFDDPYRTEYFDFVGYRAGCREFTPRELE